MTLLLIVYKELAPIRGQVVYVLSFVEARPAYGHPTVKRLHCVLLFVLYAHFFVNKMCILLTLRIAGDAAALDWVQITSGVRNRSSFGIIILIFWVICGLDWTSNLAELSFEILFNK